MKLIIILIFFLITKSVFSQDHHSSFIEILKRNVADGKVNYQSLLSEKSFDKYLDQLKNTNPDTIKNSNDKMAFWINAYNAYTLKIILDNYPVESINDLHSGGLILGSIFNTTVWDKDFVIINNKETSLSNIEHKILRKKFNEPRIHFAIVCASISCPPLRDEAFEGYKLDKQLTDQAKLFLDDETRNEFDINKKEAEISKIFDWFEEDFGDDDEKPLLFISKYVSDKISNSIKSNVSDWDIGYLDYNWKLNE